ncbi:1330_t:CDS:1, partial [Gigaspora rosea]
QTGAILNDLAHLLEIANERGKASKIMKYSGIVKGRRDCES